MPSVVMHLSSELRVRVSRFSSIRVLDNTYSVPSRLIGSILTVRVRAEHLELYQGATKLDTLPRLIGKGGCHIDYRHLCWSLARKPGAFANYKYRDELLPSLVFRKAYDELTEAAPQRADREYVRLLHLAASTSEVEVEAALGLLLQRLSQRLIRVCRGRPIVCPVRIQERTYIVINVSEDCCSTRTVRCR